MNLSLKALLPVFAAALCLSSQAIALPAQHDAWHESNAAYRTMYDRYDTGLTRAVQYLEEKDIEALEQANDAAMAKSVQAKTAAGMPEPMAWARALGECILSMEARVTGAAIAAVSDKPDPVEGFYRLQDQDLSGYLTIIANGDGTFAIEAATWQTAAPETFGWCMGTADKLGASFTTVSVLNPSTTEANTAADMQMSLTVKDGTILLKTTEAFKKAGYVFFNAGEEMLPRDISVDGTYTLEK